MADTELIVALDFPNLDQSNIFLNKIKDAKCKVKVGKELFTAEGPRILNLIAEYGFETFLDLKFHDIPNTVAKAIKVAASYNIWMINVHASGGREMMESAKNSIANLNNPPLLTAVTLLTSIDQNAYSEIGFRDTMESQLINLAKLAYESQMDGIVCSANDIKIIAENIREKFLYVTPGIRLTDNNDDQKRTSSPKNAVNLGANYIVVGRPVTKDNDPLKKIELINKLIQE